jgi:FkbM family methyltransferase
MMKTLDTAFIHVAIFVMSTWRLAQNVFRFGRGLQIAHDGRNLFLANPDVSPDKAIIIFGIWEKRQRGYLMSQIDRFVGTGGIYTFLDIGAYGGSYSMMAARDGRCTRVVAFEPDLRNRRHLQASLFINDLSDRVEVDPRAASSNRRTAHLHMSGTHPDGNRGGVGLVTPGSHPAREVETVVIDDLFDATGQTFVIKIDVEGHEFQVLSGMKRLLAKNRCLLQVEMVGEESTRLARTLLETLGYQHIQRILGDSFFKQIADPVTEPPAARPPSTR